MEIIPDDAMALDIGPQTVTTWSKALKNALPFSEWAPRVFDGIHLQGARGVSPAMVSASTVIGGGDSAAVANLEWATS